MNLPFPRREPADLERRLRAGASAFAPEPSPALRGRILTALRAAPPRVELESAGPSRLGSSREPAARVSRASSPFGTWIAVAAALLVLVSAWLLTRSLPPRAARERTVVALSHEILGAGSRVLALPSRVEDNLRLEAVRLLSDTTRMAEGVVRGLPAPLRTKLERL